jgi:predicted lipoprotein with Yx(FWY)xxD motif
MSRLSVVMASVVVSCAAVACPTNTAAAQPPAPDVAIAQSSLGPIIVNANGMTTYVFDKDVPGSGQSACTGNCQKLWLAVTTTSDQPAAAGVLAPVATIAGSNGTKQVTVSGLPLYTYTGDKAPGDTNGQLFMSIWHVVPPLGQKVG